ncbi:MAG: mannose-6-phosphate isomerase, class I [Ilumatobacteraceae bacterium]
MRRVHGQVQRYDWGDLAAIPHLLGVEPDGQPQAELWFGTHAGGPSTLAGGRTLESEVGPLPYLLKVLAAGNSLSLQVHPSSAQARSGFDREDAAGIPLNAPQRTYRDPFHKPEIMCALTPFEAVCGIAPLDDTDELLAELGEPAANLRTILGRGGIDAVIGLLLHHRPPLEELVSAASAHPDPRCIWLSKLGLQYPGDPSAALVLFLNYVLLQPGDAIFLAAGNLHAYLHGTGVEVMASSDNVVRAGLTNKHVDPDEVLRVLDTRPLHEPVVWPELTSDGGSNYPVPVSDFRVTRYDIDGSIDFVADGPELLLCTNGETVELDQGECVLATHGEAVELVGTATVYRVGGAPWISAD